MNASTEARLTAAEDTFNTWDAELNRLYGIIRDKLPPDEFEKLREIQLKWIADKEDEVAQMTVADEHSEWYYRTSKMNSYLIMHTAERTLELAHLHLTDNNPDRTYPGVSSENETSVSTAEIREILEAPTVETVEKYNITDENIIAREGVLPTFLCESPEMEISFAEGWTGDTLETVMDYNDHPYAVWPLYGTTVSFNDGRAFRVGENMRLIIERLGEGDYSIYWNELGDTLSYCLEYEIDGLKISFSSYEEGFGGYMVGFHTDQE
jgi:uncharacterized protein YecT (DUF1311 family)